MPAPVDATRTPVEFGDRRGDDEDLTEQFAELLRRVEQEAREADRWTAGA